MSELSLYAKKMRMLQQRLHREELKLARLKTKANAARQSDARLKLRLGGLIYLVNRQNLSEVDLEKLVVQVKDSIDDADRIESHRIGGENLLRRLEHKKNKSNEKVDETQRREIIHRKITIGGMFVKHGLDKVARSVVLGALLEIRDSPI